MPAARSMLRQRQHDRLMPPETRFTRSGNVHIAYQVVGDGPMDLVYVPGWVSHVELAWEEPSRASFLERLAALSHPSGVDSRHSRLSDPFARFLKKLMGGTASRRPRAPARLGFCT